MMLPLVGQSDPWLSESDFTGNDAVSFLGPNAISGAADQIADMRLKKALFVTDPVCSGRLRVESDAAPCLPSSIINVSIAILISIIIEQHVLNVISTNGG